MPSDQALKRIIYAFPIHWPFQPENVRHVVGLFFSLKLLQHIHPLLGRGQRIGILIRRRKQIFIR